MQEFGLRILDREAAVDLTLGTQTRRSSLTERPEAASGSRPLTKAILRQSADQAGVNVSAAGYKLYVINADGSGGLLPKKKVLSEPGQEVCSRMMSE